MSIRPDRTTYFFIAPHPIHGTFAPIKMATEYPLGENNTQEEAWSDAKRRAEEWAIKNFPGLDLMAAEMMSYGQSYVSHPVEINIQNEKVEIAIENAQTLDELKEVKRLYPVMTIVMMKSYNNRMEELANQSPKLFTDGLE